MFGLEKYADLLGKPGEGIHRRRIGGLALVDLAGTLVIASGISWWKGFGWQGYVATFVLTWAAGMVAHRLFGVKTPTSI